MAGRKGGHVVSSAPFQSGGFLAKACLSLVVLPRPAILGRVRHTSIANGHVRSAKPCSHAASSPPTGSGLPRLLSADQCRAAGAPLQDHTGRCTIVLCFAGYGRASRPARRRTAFATLWPARFRHHRACHNADLTHIPDDRNVPAWIRLTEGRKIFARQKRRKRFPAAVQQERVETSGRSARISPCNRRD